MDAGTYAVARGEQIAMSSSVPSSGLLRQAILAHEVAHVVQQRQPRGVGGDAEGDANRSALAALSGQPARPQARAGLALQRCSRSEPTPAPAPRVQEPDPVDALRSLLRTRVADNVLDSADWTAIYRQVSASNTGEGTLQDLLSELGLETDAARQAGVIGARSGPTLDIFRGTYRTALTGNPKVLATDPLPPLLSVALADNVLDENELSAIRSLAVNTSQGIPILADLLPRAGLGAVDSADLYRLFDPDAFRFEALLSDAFSLPLRFTRVGASIRPAGDLRIPLLRMMALHHSAFDAREIPVIRGIFGAMSQQDANRLWQSAGFDAQAAEALAMQFSRVNYRYNERVSLDIPLRVSGASIGLGVAFRAAPDNPFRSDMSAIAPGGAAVNIGNYRFPSGLSQEAFRQSIAVRGRSLPMVYSTSISPFALIPLLSAVDNALGRVPHHHLALVRLLVVDPGTRVNAIADASPEGGRITYYQGSNIAGVDLVHEVGHLVHFDTVRRSPDLWSRWNAAIQADGRVVSTYGLQSRYEDFAEAYVLRLGGASTTRFPNRFAILDPLIQGVAAGRPPVTP